MNTKNVTWNGKPIDDLTPEETRQALIDAVARIEYYMRQPERQRAEAALWLDRDLVVSDWWSSVRERRKRILGW